MADQVDALFCAGLEEEASGKFSPAAEHYERAHALCNTQGSAVRLTPFYANRCLSLGHAFVRDEQFERSLRYLLEADAAARDMIPANYELQCAAGLQLHNVYVKMERFIEAHASANAALACSSGNVANFLDASRAVMFHLKNTCQHEEYAQVAGRAIEMCLSHPNGAVIYHDAISSLRQRAVEVNLPPKPLGRNLGSDIQVARAALKQSIHRHGTNSGMTVDAMAVFGMALSANGDRVGAEAVFADALAIQETTVSVQSLRYADTLHGYALLIASQAGRAGEALPLYEHVVAVRREKLPPDHSELAIALSSNFAVVLPRGARRCSLGKGFSGRGYLDKPPAVADSLRRAGLRAQIAARRRAAGPVRGLPAHLLLREGVPDRGLEAGGRPQVGVQGAVCGQRCHGRRGQGGGGLEAELQRLHLADAYRGRYVYVYIHTSMHINIIYIYMYMHMYI